MAGSYQSPGSDAVDLTALVKELHMAGDEVYSIRFEKGTASGYKKPEISSLTINDEAINIFGNSFFIVLPLETGVNFNVQTDLDALEKNFSPNRITSYNVCYTKLLRKKRAEILARPEWKRRYRTRL